MTTEPDGAWRAGAGAAHDLITALADAGMSPEQIDAVTEDVFGGRYERPTPMSEHFYAEFDRTAAIYVADLRELEAG